MKGSRCPRASGQERAGMNDQERLAQFEGVLADLVAENALVLQQLEALRAQGKVKTATYQQLTARKLALKSMLALFEERGLL